MTAVPVIIMTLIDHDMEDFSRVRSRVENVSALDFLPMSGTDSIFEDYEDLKRGVVLLNGVPLDAARSILRKSCRGRVKLHIGVVTGTGAQALTEYDAGWDRGLDVG